MTRPYILAESTYRTVSSARYEIAILPWGATEAHNYHLPYATDNVQCDWIAAEAARVAWERGAKVVVLPTVPFGVNTGQLDIPLTINMNPSTQIAVLRDVVEALDGQGLRKLVLLNGHGGNDFRQMIREVSPRTKVFICAVDWWKVVDPAGFFEKSGDHAGELETSVMLHVAPDLVRPLGEAGAGAAKRPRPRAMREGWAWSPRAWTRVTADTGIGDPSRATAAKGARYAEAVVGRIADFLVELRDTDPKDLYE
ncbi:MAG TPA: creatininase family protein [Gemmatimonadaceae bacterium]|jgi:creatinine amidohydrolase